MVHCPDVEEGSGQKRVISQRTLGTLEKMPSKDTWGKEEGAGKGPADSGLT